MTLIELSQRLSGVSAKELAEESLSENRPSLLDIKRQQLKEGKGKSGYLPGYTDPRYAAKKHGMNGLPPYGVMDALYTGEFYSTLMLDEQTSRILSPLPYAKYLERKAGAYELYGLNNEGAGEAQKIVHRTIIDQLSRITGLKVA